MQWSSSVRRVESLAQHGAGPWSRDELLELGWTPRQLERDARAGRLHRLRRGLYARTAPGPDWSVPSSYAPFLAGSPRAVVSHESTARVAGLWLPVDADLRVHLTTEDRPLPSDPAVRRHRAVLPADDVVAVEGVAFTTVPRTAVDLALGRPLRHALAALDGAVGRLALGGAWCTPAGRRMLGTDAGRAAEARARAALVESASRAAGRNGCRALARALPWVNARSESPYESWSRGVLIGAGLVPEAVGYEVTGASGRRYFADMAWPSLRLLIEVDGLAKYGSDPRTLRERLAAERHRQADLEDAGWTVVRWTAGERADAIVARVRRALAAS